MMYKKSFLYSTKVKSITAGALLLSTHLASAIDLSTSVSIKDKAFTYDESVKVTISIKNNEQQAVKVLKDMTGINGVNEQLLQLSIQGFDVEYVGPYFKKMPPSMDDFITIGAGETLSSTVDISETYDFYTSADYSIQYAASFIPGVNVISLDNSTTQKHNFSVSTAKTTWIDARLLKTDSTVTMVDSTDAETGISFSGQCSEAQQNTIKASITSAESISRSSFQNLKNYTVADRSRSPRYTTWFGAYTKSRWETVQSNFEKIADAFKDQSITVDCACAAADIQANRENTYAYVYKNKAYEIYVCPAFWRAPDNGQDSKSGTMVHEMSHFTVVANTVDDAYGHTNAKNLAKNSPDKAIKNADSHEYYAENTPSIDDTPTPTSTPTPTPTTQTTTPDVTVSGAISEPADKVIIEPLPITTDF